MADAGRLKPTLARMVVVVDDRVLARLLRGEVHRMNQALVERPVLLGTLLTYESPTATTMGGGAHTFDRSVLETMWTRLSPLARSTLTIPIRFHIPHDHPGDCFAADQETFDALEQLGLSGAVRDGRFWLSLPRAVDFGRRWPTAVEFARR